MAYIPVTSPSVFTTNQGDSLPTHSVFLSANSYGVHSGAPGTAYPPSVSNDPRAQNGSYQHAQIAWAANENTNDNIPAIEVSKSLELFPSVASKNSNTKVYEPERWSYSDASLSGQPFRLQGGDRARSMISPNAVTIGTTSDFPNSNIDASQKKSIERKMPTSTQQTARQVQHSLANLRPKNTNKEPLTILPSQRAQQHPCQVDQNPSKKYLLKI